MNRIGFIVECFPSLTETFIRRELEELHRNGIEFRVYALRAQDNTIPTSVCNDLMSLTHYAPRILSRQTLSAQSLFLIRHPRRYFATLWRLLAGNAFSFRHLVSALIHFPVATSFAERMSIDRIDHIHAHFVNLPTTLAYIASKLLSISFSFSAHARDIYVSPSMLKEKLRSASVVITCCQYNRRLLLENSGRKYASKIHVVYHGVNVDKFSRTSVDSNDSRLRELTHFRPADNRLVLFVGRLLEKKGCHYLLEACARLRHTGFAFHCVVVGPGADEHELLSLRNGLGIADIVEFIGPVSEDDLVLLYSRADVVALPCVVDRRGDHDGIPNALIEAMAMEVATITTGVGGIPELVCDGDNGILVPERNTAELASAIASLLSDNRRRLYLASRGRATVLERFDVRSNVRYLIALWQGCSCSPRPNNSKGRPL